VPARLLDKREARIQRMFGEIAPWYDFLNHLLSLNIDRHWRARTVRRVPPAPPVAAPILDLCTGTGDLALAYDRVARGLVPIYAADFCQEMLVCGARKASAAGARNRIHFVKADAQALPFPADTFQIVAIAFGLRNITDTSTGIAEMVRVARPGGRIAILEFSRPRNWLLGSLYRMYFRYLLPLIGQVLCRNRESAYRYLPESVLRFPDYDALAAQLRFHGLVDVVYEPLTFGIATLYLGTKPAARPDTSCGGG